MGEATTWTMDGGDVAVSLDGLVARVAIERPAALNALNRSVLEQLDEAWTRVEQSGARALVVTGAGRAFVAGADIAQMKAMGREEAREFSQFGNAVFRRLERLPVPSVAAVNGFALGGGCELALACDIRLASQAAVFGQPEVGLGITPG
ncbi:MAG: enoyl-CoA hydratase/isomerase family protein, partial [Propionibacteriaceae bacterium]|nr:enoyl-CoA hydratase/isomerase family protein [Propionibacteriaceae bacterium]